MSRFPCLLVLGLTLPLMSTACGDDSGSSDGPGGSGGTADGGASGGLGGGGGGSAGGGGLPPAFADVEVVGFSGSNLDYQVAVTISSPDTGCEQYADWWEVITPDGELIYRETFDGPHLDEQPFMSIVPGVPIESNEFYIYRAHMHPHGYGGAFKLTDQKGSVSPDTTDYSSSFPDLADMDPQPPPCME